MDSAWINSLGTPKVAQGSSRIVTVIAFTFTAIIMSFNTAGPVMAIFLTNVSFRYVTVVASFFTLFTPWKLIFTSISA